MPAREVVAFCVGADPPASGDRPRDERLPSRGDAALSFDALVAAYDRRIFNIAYRFLGDYDEAADVTQETFISAYKSYDQFRGEASVYTWLCQIALNNCRNRVRRRGRRVDATAESLDQPRSLADGASGDTLEVPDLTHAPHTVLESKEMRERLLAAVDSLPPDYREVVVLREMQGMSYNDIADATGLSLDNVKTRLSRARLMLRRKLEPYISNR
ncbi:MAG TPA: sigma-70 family RNA polymerase sigma factor [Chthonomonadales bacterium]|nr:sigma-70 family RNA polymerase sigma factor [Chthonomonadales bacterium]